MAGFGCLGAGVALEVCGGGRAVAGSVLWLISRSQAWGNDAQGTKGLGAGG